jgi:hypothetical protein
MSGQTRILASALFLTAISGCMFRHKTFADRVDTPDWPDFAKNVNDYVTAVSAIEKTLPPLSDRATASEVVAHQQAMAKAIRAERKTAQPGDIFSPSIRKRFVKVVRSEAKGTAGKTTRAIIREDNPNAAGTKPAVTLAVNAVYPDAPPLSTMPPTLLLRLPVLPKTVEYRFVGKALVLRDVRANTIVDWVPYTLP